MDGKWYKYNDKGNLFTFIEVWTTLGREQSLNESLLGSLTFARDPMLFIFQRTSKKFLNEYIN